MRVVALVNQKGGSGKSTLAACLAVAAQEAGERVFLIDMDPQKSLLKWGSSPPGQGFAGRGGDGGEARGGDRGARPRTRYARHRRYAGHRLARGRCRDARAPTSA